MNVKKNVVQIILVLLLAMACNNIKQVDNSSIDKDLEVIEIDSIISLEPITVIEPKAEPTSTPTHKAKTAAKKWNSSLPVSNHISEFKLRKYSHVTEMYLGLVQSTIDLCVANKVPPAAILAIVSLESGWGSGYIGQITGNILSLNATKSATKLPALYLPVVKKNGKVLFDEKEIAKYDSSELEYQNRPASLKKDYRPAGIAGTKKNLAYFNYHHDEKIKAEVRCINDFINRFVSYKSSIAAYREARTIMDAHVEKNGIEALFDKNVNVQFINTIGGRPNSFNFRETWPIKVEAILNGAGLVELTKDMHLNRKSFSEAW